MSRRALLLAVLCFTTLTACNVRARGIENWQVYTGTEFPGDTSEWQDYTPRTRVPGNLDTDQARYWLRTTLPDEGLENPGIYLYDVRHTLNVYIDGELLLRMGRMETSGDQNEEARYRVLTAWPIVRLPRDAGGKTLLLECVEPDDQREGILGGVFYGDYDARQRHFLAIDLDMLILGGFFMMVAVGALLMAIIRRDTGMILAFGLFALSASSQALVYSEVIFYLIPDTISYLRGFTVQILIGALMLFVDRSIGRGPVYINRIAWILFFLYALFLALSGEVAGVWFNFVSIPLVLFMLGYLGYKATHGALEARIVLGGVALFALTGLNDALLSALILPHSIFLAQWGVFMLVLALGLTLILRFFQNEARLREYAHELEILNKAYERFVPAEFLNQLGKESITAVELGDQVEKSMTVLFSDIRSFTTLSEQLSPAETFAFINTFLERMGPVIRRHGGFIDKYIGDAIMALFPGAPDAALNAARDMNVELERLNVLRKERNLPEIHIGIGIHIGRLMLGTIGEAERMEGTVISDSVNLASRLEGLTKKAGQTILISEAVRDALTRPGDFTLQPLGEAKVKGKERTVKVFGLSIS